MGAQPEVSMATMEVTGVGKRHPPQNFCDAKIITASWQLRGRGRACCSTGVSAGAPPGDTGTPRRLTKCLGHLRGCRTEGPSDQDALACSCRRPGSACGGHTRHARSRAPAGRTQLPRRRAPRLRVSQLGLSVFRPPTLEDAPSVCTRLRQSQGPLHKDHLVARVSPRAHPACWALN